MKKFQGTIIASDWDGTLAINGEIPKENIEAIKYFQQNGGLFTVCSGRHFSYFKQFQDIIMPNTYTMWYNGALITNGKNYDIVYRDYITNDAFRIVDYIVNNNIQCHSISFSIGNDNDPSYSVDEYKSSKDYIMSLNIYKILVVTKDAEYGEKAMQLIKNYDLGDYIVVRSFCNGVEIIKKQNSKGSAVKRIATMCNATRIICVGDYENDIDMIEIADIGYAVQNARDNVKEIADRITVKEAKDGAIAEIIENLSKEKTSD